MHITYISIFPDIFQSFLHASLVKKAQDKKILSFECIDPRSFCPDKNKQVDDEIYGGGAGLLMKAKPVIDAVMHAIEGLRKRILEKEESLQKEEEKDVFLPSFKIIFLSPSPLIFSQQTAHDLAKEENLIFVCGRYEGIDHRFEVWAQQTFGENFLKISLGKFVTLGGEIPAMTMTEAIVRLIPDVIKEQGSRQNESYRPEYDMNNLEYPQYTRPEDVLEMKVPDVLLNGNHAHIAQRRKENTTSSLSD